MINTNWHRILLSEIIVLSAFVASATALSVDCWEAPEYPGSNCGMSCNPKCCSFCDDCERNDGAITLVDEGTLELFIGPSTQDCENCACQCPNTEGMNNKSCTIEVSQSYTEGIEASVGATIETGFEAVKAALEASIGHSEQRMKTVGSSCQINVSPCYEQVHGLKFYVREDIEKEQAHDYTMLQTDCCPTCGDPYEVGIGDDVSTVVGDDWGQTHTDCYSVSGPDACP